MSLLGRRPPPPSVARYLLEGETDPEDPEDRPFSVRQHWLVPAPWVALIVGAFLGALLLSSRFDPTSNVQVVIWLVFLAATVWSGIQIWLWWVNWFTVTKKRFVLITGILVRKVAMMPLGRVTDMSYQLTIGGRIFGYGEFVLESAGQDQALRSVPFLPDPDGVYKIVCNWIFPERLQENDELPPDEQDEEGDPPDEDATADEPPADPIPRPFP